MHLWAKAAINLIRKLSFVKKRNYALKLSGNHWEKVAGWLQRDDEIDALRDFGIEPETFK